MFDKPNNKILTKSRVRALSPKKGLLKVDEFSRLLKLSWNGATLYEAIPRYQGSVWH
jgi:hypothetical protein